MNILVPDSWLHEYLHTKATPEQIKEYLSLCGPSVERTHTAGGEIIYNIEVTSNRPDSMSVVGIAREAAAILPRFGIAAKLAGDPYAEKVRPFQARNPKKSLRVKTDPELNPRWTSIVIENVTVKPSPDWLKKKLESTGIRSINNVIDITNYLMRAYGQPAHAFDFDAISGGKPTATMTLRASKKGERITTLDGKSHKLPGNDIVIEDAKGRLIDLCGIMGAQNSSITQTTKTVILFLQTYSPTHIRKTSMSLAHRTEAAALFEKETDSELVMPVFLEGVRLVGELTGGRAASKIYDIYPNPYKAQTASVARVKVDAYLGVHLPDKDIISILTSLGFPTKVSSKDIRVSVPSFRRDVAIDVDIIEELARIYGYHNIQTKLPDTEPPVVTPDPVLGWEEEIKTRLRDWGYTELYTYSMISEELMDIFGLDKQKAYKIANPLSSEWVYMRPHLFPSVLACAKENLNIRSDFKAFELSMAYQYRPNDLPQEVPTLVVLWTGHKFLEAKGLAKALFHLFGMDIPEQTHNDIRQPLRWYGATKLALGEFGSVGEVNTELLTNMGIHTPITRLFLDFGKLVAAAHPTKTYQPIPKYPASFEDIAFVLPDKTPIGPVMETVKATDPLIADVTLLDSHGDTRTLHVTYLSTAKNLTSDDIRPVREKIIDAVTKRFGGTLKTSS